MTEAAEKADTTAAVAGSGTPAEPVYRRNGLVVERVYTTEGVHPYDEVVWVSIRHCPLDDRCPVALWF